MKVLGVVQAAALVLIALTAVWVATHGIAIEVHHTGGVTVGCPMLGSCPGVNP